MKNRKHEEQKHTLQQWPRYRSHGGYRRGWGGRGGGGGGGGGGKGGLDPRFLEAKEFCFPNRLVKSIGVLKFLPFHMKYDYIEN